MPRKQLYNRLENLFSKIEKQVEPPTTPLRPDTLPGWTWQCNQVGDYISCGSEIQKALGVTAEKVIHEKIYLLGMDTASSIRLKNLINSQANHFEEELVILGQSGAKSNIRMTGFAQFNSSGQLTGWSGFSFLLSPLRSVEPQPENPPVLPSRQTSPLNYPVPTTDAATQRSTPIIPPGQTNIVHREPVIIAGNHQPSSIAVPFEIGGEAQGVLEVKDQPGRVWTPDETALVQEVARQLALALENASLYQNLQMVAAERQNFLLQAERRALELEAAAEIARDTTRTLSLDVLLRQIVNLLSERFGFYHVSIFLLDDEGEYAVVKESTGLAGEELKRRGHRLAVGSKSIIGTAAATREPYVVNDVSHHPNYYANPLLPATKAEMGVPLKIGDRVIGALDFQATDAGVFTDDVIYVSQIIADQVAVAIENARAYELSQKALREMHELDRMKSQFLANMSHELRTPLNSIIGFSRVILKGIDGPINEIQSQDLNAIYNSGQHLLNLINDILDLSKIEAGKMTLSISELDIKELANSVMTTATGLVKDKPVQLRNQIPDGLPLVIGDHTRVRQVLLNLVSNAAKFTEKGSITLQAQPILNDGKAELMITVKDTGIGIDESDRHKLFQEFSQVDDSPTRKSGGTGLGLSICRSLIEMHGGRIGLLESIIDEGSTFFFTLPVVEAQLPATLPERENLILAIDEDPQVIAVYSRYLESTDYSIESLPHQPDLAGKIAEMQPHILIIDVAAKSYNAWDLISQLKQSVQTSSIPILVCSMLDQREKAAEAGVSEYLLKPFLQDELIQTIHRLQATQSTIRALVIDDNEEDVRLIYRLLENQSRYHLESAADSGAALTVLLQTPIDVIILDLFLQGVSGFSFLEQLQNHKLFSKIPVIVMTGADLTAEQHESLAAYGHLFLTKGFLRPGDLINALENAIKQKN